MTFYPAMIICFYLFGIGPGIFVAVLSASVGHFIFIPPYWTFFAISPGDIAVVDFLMSTALIGFVINQLQSYSRQALNSLVDLNIAATAFKSNEGMIITDDQGVILRVNQAFTESTGYTASEVVGQNPRIFKSGRHDAAFYREMWDAIKTTGTWQGEIWDRRKNGAIYPKLLTITAVKGDDGVVTHYVGIHVDITERKQLEQGLKLAQFSVDHAQDAIFRLNPKAQFLYVNDAACKHLEYSKDELLKMSLFDINPDFSPEYWSAHWDNVSNNGSKRFETRHKRKDDTLVPVEVVANCIELEGELIFTSIVRNIAERKHAEMTLLQHKAAIDTTHEGFWMTDEQGVILESNQAYAELSGYSVDALRGMQVLQFEAKEQSLDEVKAHIEKVISQGWDVFETRHRHKDGHEIELEVSISYIPDSRQFVAFFRDITERKQAEADLRIAATTFESQEGTMITNVQGVILRVNQAFTKDTGYTAEEAVGQTPRLLKSGRHNAAFYQAMWQALNQTGTWQGEIWDRRKNGEIYPKLLTITAVKGDDGVVTHYVGIHVDITAQKRLEKERERLLIEVRELSRRLIHIQEQERQAIALTLHDDIGQSLTAIKAYASSITHYCHLEDLDRILQSANEVNQISTGLLKTVRNQLRDLRPGYLKELGLKGALENLCESWENSGAIACDLKITGAVDELPEDVQVQLFRIVQEGLTNVARHAAASTASVELSTGSHGSKLDIADDGSGFDPATTVPGIGLVGMRERAFAIGGHFDLQSAPGKGTKVRIRFQVNPDQEIL